MIDKEIDSNDWYYARELYQDLKAIMHPDIYQKFLSILIESFELNIAIKLYLNVVRVNIVNIS